MPRLLLALGALLLLAGAAPAAEEGLVAHFTFDEGSGETAKDLAGGRAGKIARAPYVPSPRGSSLQFGGKESWVDIGADPALNLEGDLTIEAWVRTSKTDARNRMILGDTASLAVDRNYSLRFDRSNLIFEHGNGQTCEQLILAPGSAFTGAWQHVALVCEYPRFYFYLVGQQAKQGDLTLPITKTRGANRFIGGWWAGLFQGEIDEIRLYNRALPERLVLSHFSGKDVAPTLRASIVPSLHYARHRLTVALLLDNAPPGALTTSIRLCRPGGGKPLAEMPVAVSETRPGSGRAAAEARFDTARLPAGAYQVLAEVMDSRDSAIASPAAGVAYPKRPAWFGSRAGKGERVLAPFTPLRVAKGRLSEGATAAAAVAPSDNQIVSAWGRRHAFGGSPFLAGVESQGAALLSAPMRLVGRADGKPLEVRPGTAKVERAGGAKVSLSQSLAAGPARVAIRAAAEYDGMVRFDWSIRGERRTSLEELAVEIPLAGRHARYLYVWPTGTGGRIRPCGAFAEDAAYPFKAMVWLGDEGRGLFWFAESDRNWLLHAPERAIQVLRRGENVLLRLNLVDAPVTLAAGQSLDYTFGMQATPVKPMGKSCWDTRFAECPWYGKDYEMDTRTIDGKPALEAYAAKGVRTWLLFNPWTDVFGYTKPVGHTEELRPLVKAAHAAGLKVVPYFSFLISELAPECPYLKGDVITMPASLFTWPAGHPAIKVPQVANIVCMNSVWQDALVDGIARLIDDYDMDGVYLDSTILPFACSNVEHGCGYRSPSGAVVRTFPIFAVRETMKRIYTVVRERKPDGLVDAHVYDAMTAPGLAFVTSYFTGEQLSRPKSKHEPDGLSLDRFRAEMMGRNWGVPAEFMEYMLGDYRRCYAISLLHDVPIRPASLPNLELTSSLWRLFDAFGRREARWLPYWSNADVVSAGPADCCASLYQHPTNGVLAVVSNLGHIDAEVSLQLNLQKLGLAGTLQAKDGLTNAALPIDGGRVSFPLKSMEWKTVWIKTGG